MTPNLLLQPFLLLIYIVPWKHLNRWSNCIYITKSMDFKVSHIYKEGNTCVDSLASYGLIIPDFFFFVGHYSYFHYCCLCESKGRGVNLVGIPSPSLGQLVPAFCNNKKKKPPKNIQIKIKPILIILYFFLCELFYINLLNKEFSV